MELASLILVLSGSLLHLGWNVLTKKSHDKLAFLWLAIIPSSLICLFLDFPRQSELLNAWPWLLTSSLIHALYFWFLTSAYRFADLSFVYPYSRGVGALVATLGGIYLLKESPNQRGLLGIALTLVATFLEPGLKKSTSKINISAVLMTVATGVCIASYILIDKRGISVMSPVSYLSLMLLGSALLLSPLMLMKKRAILEFNRRRLHPLLGSLFLFSAYVLVLKAMVNAPVAYVVAARASGIIFSGLAGILFFKENVAGIRWIAIALITFGVYLIGTA